MTVPLTVLSFIILHYLYGWMSNLKIGKVFRPFCTIAGLGMSLIGDNIQYLTFRAFQQILYVAPSPRFICLLSLLLAIFTLFLTIFVGAALPLLILRYRRRSFEH